jgi:hypothetical protein
VLSFFSFLCTNFALDTVLLRKPRETRYGAKCVVEWQWQYEFWYGGEIQVARQPCLISLWNAAGVDSGRASAISRMFVKHELGTSSLLFWNVLHASTMASFACATSDEKDFTKHLSVDLRLFVRTSC